MVTNTDEVFVTAVIVIGSLPSALPLTVGYGVDRPITLMLVVRCPLSLGINGCFLCLDCAH